MNTTDRWYPERFFYSHASVDDRLTRMVKDVLESDPGQFEVYVAERGLVGTPLMQKLRAEMLNCNAVLVAWTRSANRKSTSQVMSFELGMAYSLQLPVYLLRVSKAKMPWFFDKLTDYADVSSSTEPDVKAAIAKIEPSTFCHPIDFTCPREPYSKIGSAGNASRNEDVVGEDGTIALLPGFNGILHFHVCSRRARVERDVRLVMRFPPEIGVIFDAGTLDQTSAVQRNDVFDMRQTSPGEVRMYWPSFPPQDFLFELRLTTPSGQLASSHDLTCMLSSETLVGWRFKTIPLTIGVADGTGRS